MDTLINKKYNTFAYTSRYSHLPYYYDTKSGREVYGIGTHLKSGTASTTYKVKPADTLHSLALIYYNNPTYWWVIADFNRILDPFVPLFKKYRTLQIPVLSDIEFGEVRD